MRLRRSGGWLALVLALVLRGAADAAPPRERTFPVLRVFDTTEDGAGIQSWDVAQDERGILYFANLTGVLEFDGVRWRRIPLPHAGPCFSVAPIGGGRIGVGGVDELGWLEPDARGAMRYVSLAARVPRELSRFDQVVSIHRLEDGSVAYATVRGILRWNGSSVSAVDAHAKPEELRFPSNAVASTPRGLERITPAGSTPLRGGELFAGRLVNALAEWPAGKRIAGLRKEGLLLWDGGEARPFSPEASRRIVRDSLTALVPLPDGRLAVATRKGGVLFLDASGDVVQVLDASTGLPDVDVNRAFLAADGALWLALDNGVARVDVSSPVSVIDTRGGLRGAVEAIVRHCGTLWAGTTSGLFVLGGAAGGPVARQVATPDRQPMAAWSLLPWGEDLLVGGDDDVWVVRDGRPPERIAGSGQRTGYALRRSRQDPDLVFAGTSSGLLEIRRDRGAFRCSGPVAGTDTTVRTIVEEPPGTLWLGTELRGVLRVARQSGEVTPFGKDQVASFAARGRALFVPAEGTRLHALDPARNRFVPDTLLGAVGDDGPLTAVAEGPDGRVWTAGRGLCAAEPGPGGAYRVAGRLFAGTPGASVDSLYAEAGTVWLGSDRGLVRYEPRALHAEAPPRAPLVREVTLGGKPLGPRDEVLAGSARLRVEVSAVTFEPGTRYRFRLAPAESAWSDWTPQPFTEFTNLWEGSYRMETQARNASGAEGPVAAWEFRVRAPWYRTTWAWLLWSALAVVVLGGFSAIQTRSLERRADALEERVAEKTHELSEAVAELRTARDELERKNRELESANARLEELSFDDPLTGIANRRRFDETLRAEWARARRTGTPVGLVIADIDFFKKLNDTLGHPEGDECLKNVARVLAQGLQRSGDLVARYGGEEFAVLVPNAPPATAADLAERLREGVAALRIPHPGSPHGVLTASFGAASAVPGPDSTAEDLVAAADRALYAAKDAGRNVVRVA